MNPAGWRKFPLLGPLVSCEMLRKQNQDLGFFNSNYEVVEQKCYIQLSKYLAFHCWGRGGFDHYLVTYTILFFRQYSHLVFLFVYAVQYSDMNVKLRTILCLKQNNRSINIVFLPAVMLSDVGEMRGCCSFYTFFNVVLSPFFILPV